jgi:hypothetical protein
MVWSIFKKKIVKLIVVHSFSIYLVNMIRMVHLLVCLRIFCFCLMSETIEGFCSIEKKIPMKTNKNSQDPIYEMQNNELERLDLHTLVDHTAEMFRRTWSA